MWVYLHELNCKYVNVYVDVSKSFVNVWMLSYVYNVVKIFGNGVKIAWNRQIENVQCAHVWKGWWSDMYTSML